MVIGDLFKQASEDGYRDLQALIMFLVFEKQVLSMEDDASGLDLYFMENHNKRMNSELASYKNKMNIRCEPHVFELKNERRTIYIYAKSQKQAKYIAYQNMFKAEKIRTCDLDELMNCEGNDITLRSLITNKKAPLLLGGF